MINISEFAVIGALQAFLVLTIGLVIFIILNHKLRVRIKTLASWLEQLKAKTTELLAASSNQEQRSYTDYLNEESKLTTGKFEQEYPDKTIEVGINNSADENLIALRHLFLQAEIAAAPVTDEVEKWHQISQKLDLVVGYLATDLSFELAAEGNKDSAFDIAQKWQEFCEASVSTFASSNNEATDAFVNLLQTINNDLGFEAIVSPSSVEGKTASVTRAEMPAGPEKKQENEPAEDQQTEDSEFAETIELTSPITKSNGESPSSPVAIERHNHRIDVDKLKETTSRQQALIDSLQQENQDANSAITLKASELNQLQSFFDEATGCLERIENELDASISRTAELEKELEDVPDMKALIRRFTEESSNMLTCIETLEKENEVLRQSNAG